VADLVTHVCVVLLPGALVRSPLVAAVAVGTVIPDVCGRAVPLALDAVRRAGGPVPESVIWPWAALHEPLGWSLVCVLIAMSFVEHQRWPVLRALWLGGAVHTALDLLQDHHGQGYLLLAPWSLHTFELGWIGSEATVGFAVPLAVLTACAWLLRRRLSG
jgi:hypothetical protein